MPSPVDKYFKEVKDGNPSYSDEQAWATAWSIYCRHKAPGSPHCHRSPDEYLTGKSAGLLMRVVGRFAKEESARTVLAFEHPSPEARRDYLKEHPQANPANHTVKKPGKHPPPAEHGKKEEPKKDKEHGEEHGEKHEEEKPKKSWKERLKGLSEAAVKFVSGAPKAVKQFIEDDAYRRGALMAAHKAFTEAPEKIVASVKNTVKHEVKEFKLAGQGIAAVLKGGKMSKHQKEAMKTVSFHMGVGIAAAALTAAGPLAAVGTFAKGLARHIAAKSVSNAMGHLHVLDEFGHIGHGVKHFMEHMSSDATKEEGSPEAVLYRALLAAEKGEKADPEDVLANFIAAAVAKEMTKLTDEDIQKALNDMKSSEKADDKGEAKKAALVVARYLGV